LGEFGPQALGGERVDRLVRQSLDIDVLEDRGGDPVGERLLHRGVGGQRPDGLDEPVGVGHLVVGPDRDQRHRHQHTAEDQQHDGDDGPPADAPTRSAGAGPQCRVLPP
jgi:hypothetical protein